MHYKLIFAFPRSKTLFFCIEFPSLRVIHRSLLAEKIKSSGADTKDLEELLDALDKKEKKNKVTINKPDHKGVAPLHLSLERDIKVTKELLNHGAEVDILNSEAKTALYLTCQKKDIKRATTLLFINRKTVPTVPAGTSSSSPIQVTWAPTEKSLIKPCVLDEY